MDKLTKLSDAIRLGASFRPQCRGRLFLQQGNEIHSCAIGAALEAYGVTAHEFLLDPNTLPTMRRLGMLVEGDCASSLFKDIARRNDSGQTREEIAEWLSAKGL